MSDEKNIATYLEDEELVSDLDDYFTFDDIISLHDRKIDVEKARDYAKETGKKVFDDGSLTAEFKTWYGKQKKGWMDTSGNFHESEKKEEVKEEPVEELETGDMLEIFEKKFHTKIEKKEEDDDDLDFMFDDEEQEIIEKHNEEQVEKEIEKSAKAVEKEFEEGTEDDLMFLNEEPVSNPDDMIADKKNKVYTKSKAKKRTIINQDIVFDLDNYPVIAVFWGYYGGSKSEQILKFRDAKGRPALIFDFENKLRSIANKLKFPQENIITSGKYNETYDIDGPATLRDFRILLDEIKQRFRKKDRKLNFSAIGLDGISDLRPYAKKEWLAEHPKRKNPVTPKDHGEINNKVRDIIFSIINLGREENVHILLTAQVGGIYKDNVKIRDIADCKGWVLHNVDHIFYMYAENKEFYAYCEKSFYDPFWTINLTDWTHQDKPSLINILQKPDLLQKYIAEYEKEEADKEEESLDFLDEGTT